VPVFLGKWQGQVEGWHYLMQLLLAGQYIVINPLDVVKAVSQYKKPNKVYHVGLCPEALSMAILVHSQQCTRLFTRLTNTQRWLQAIIIEAPMKAKLRGPIQSMDTRVLLVQPILLQIFHNVTISRLEGTMKQRIET
jgi:hypothetical protein